MSIQGNCRRNKLTRLLTRDGNRCHWCQTDFTALCPPTFEHLIPRHYGGTDHDSNLVLACEPCNTGRQHHVRCVVCHHRVRTFSAAAWITKHTVIHTPCAVRISKTYPTVNAA